MFHDFRYQIWGTKVPDGSADLRSDSDIPLVAINGNSNSSYIGANIAQFLQYCKLKYCLVQVGNGIELEAVGLLFEPYLWRPCSVTWASQTVLVLKLLRTSALQYCAMCS